ncbi:MAG: methionyl-tRNA formyltransferase [candidate division Zixibacteria bacterium]|nr:methionyl-tRNA formyltransferase [candidate division Zixibacteria bacterium]
MNLVFMGTPEFACVGLKTLVESSHKVLAVVTMPDKPAGRGRKLMPSAVKKAALSFELPIMQPNNLRDNEFIEEISALNADLFVVIAFKVLPKKLYSIPKQGSINIHGSLLPKYRGAAPINHALLNGDTETGLTSFFLNRKVDGGAIIGQSALSIDINENFSSLYQRLAELSGPFLLETLDKITRNDFVSEKQNRKSVGGAPKISTEDCRINWESKVNAVHNHIRAFSEKPGAFCFLDSMKVKILATRMDGISEPPDLTPGELIARKKELIVGTGDSPLRIIKIQPEGKKAMDASAFINGYISSNRNELTADRKEVN